MGAVAQTPVTLEQIDSLIVVGRAEEARTVLSGWWQRAARAAIDRAQMQHAIWLRAVLTVDPTQASIDYQRLVVEYPGGPYTDRSLLRLAQAADARGDAVKARGHLRSLLRDYPASPIRADAERLLQSVEPAAEAQAQAQPLVAPAVAPERVAAPPTVAAADRQAAAPRTSSQPGPAVPPAPRPAAAPSTTAPDSVVLPRAIAGSWTVQLGAFASPERARALGTEIAAGGSEVRIVVVPPSRLIRVRTGRFLSQGAAEGLRNALVARGLEATVAGDADREEMAK